MQHVQHWSQEVCYTWTEYRVRLTVCTAQALTALLPAWASGSKAGAV